MLDSSLLLFTIVCFSLLICFKDKLLELELGLESKLRLSVSQKEITILKNIILKNKNYF